MSKSLKAIQIIVKVAKVLATIVFVCSIIGGVGCLVALFAFAAVQEVIIPLLEENSVMTAADIIFTFVSGVIFCAGEAVLAKFAMVYCEHELQAGTPFTYDGAKEVLRLGILSLAIPAGISLVVSVAYGILTLIYPDMLVTMENSFSMTTGLALLAASVVFRYGAELSERAEKQTAFEECPQEIEETK